MIASEETHAPSSSSSSTVAPPPIMVRVRTLDGYIRLLIGLVALLWFTIAKVGPVTTNVLEAGKNAKEGRDFAEQTKTGMDTFERQQRAANDSVKYHLYRLDSSVARINRKLRFPAIVLPQIGATGQRFNDRPAFYGGYNDQSNFRTH